LGYSNFYKENRTATVVVSDVTNSRPQRRKGAKLRQNFLIHCAFASWWQKTITEVNWWTGYWCDDLWNWWSNFGHQQRR